MSYVVFRHIVHGSTCSEQRETIRLTFPLAGAQFTDQLTEYNPVGSPKREKWIKCSLEQFAEFIIHRYDTGMMNRIKELQPRIENEEPETPIFDLR